MINSKKNKINNSEILEKLASNSLRICVVGIGRIGLPTALAFAKSGLTTIGVDINTDLVNSINSGNLPQEDEPGYKKIFDEVFKKGRFSATTDLEQAIPKSDVILLSLPTPMNEKNMPDYSAITFVGKQLSKILKLNSLVIIESTIEPGFIENEFVKIMEEDHRLKAGKNFLIGVCPENANPGQILHDFSTLPRLVGGLDEKTSNIIQKIYSFVFGVELIIVPNCKTANAVKLTTNVFRDINIAFINELSIMFEKLGIDTMKVLEAAKKKYNFQIHYPGAGVGGPCLPINSYQLLNTAKRTGVTLNIIESGRRINEKMPEHVIELTLDAFKECNKPIQNSDILILGISYKPNVKDIQLTPAEHIIKKLQNHGANVHIFDPYFSSSKVYGINVEKNLDDIISKVNASILVTGHEEFKKIAPSVFNQMKNPILIDTQGIIDPADAKQAKLIFRGLGRGKL